MFLLGMFKLTFSFSTELFEIIKGFSKQKSSAFQISFGPSMSLGQTFPGQYVLDLERSTICVGGIVVRIHIDGHMWQHCD